MVYVASHVVLISLLGNAPLFILTRHVLYMSDCTVLTSL